MRDVINGRSLRILKLLLHNKSSSILNENIKLMIVSLHLINVTTVQEFNEMVVTSTGSILPDLRDFFFYLNHSRHVIFSVHELEFRTLE